MPCSSWHSQYLIHHLTQTDHVLKYEKLTKHGDPILTKFSI